MIKSICFLALLLLCSCASSITSPSSPARKMVLEIAATSLDGNEHLVCRLERRVRDYAGHQFLGTMISGKSTQEATATVYLIDEAKKIKTEIATFPINVLYHDGAALSMTWYVDAHRAVLVSDNTAHIIDLYENTVSTLFENVWISERGYNQKGAATKRLEAVVLNKLRHPVERVCAASYALGMIGDFNSVPSLIYALRYDEPEIQTMVVRALYQITKKDMKYPVSGSVLERREIIDLWTSWWEKYIETNSQNMIAPRLSVQRPVSSN